MATDGIVFQALDDRRVELDRHKENSSRMAEARGRFESTGTGSIEFETRVDFGVTFVEEPCISFGSQIDVDELERVLESWASGAGLTDAQHALLFPGGKDSGTPSFPMVSGFVTDWDTDHKGFFIGAWCGVRVYYPPLIDVATQTEVLAPVVITHHFRFSGVGMKDVPTALTD